MRRTFLSPLSPPDITTPEKFINYCREKKCNNEEIISRIRTDFPNFSKDDFIQYLLKNDFTLTEIYEFFNVASKAFQDLDTLLKNIPQFIGYYERERLPGLIDWISGIIFYLFDNGNFTTNLIDHQQFFKGEFILWILDSKYENRYKFVASLISYELEENDAYLPYTLIKELRYEQILTLSPLIPETSKSKPFKLALLIHLDEISQKDKKYREHFLQIKKQYLSTFTVTELYDSTIIQEHYLYGLEVNV